ncbi:hypothetical protein WJX79_003197 [Trebouxia sp. C0005]
MSCSSHWFQALPLIRELSLRGHSCQVVLTLGGAARFAPSLRNLSNIEILTYNTSNVEEMDLRQAVRLNLRSVGIDSIRSTFGIPPHSHPLLQDAELHRKIQAFEPDLALTDIALVGGAALADKLGIPKAIMSVPGLLPPVSGHSYGSGASLRSTVPQWMTLLPKHMSFIQRFQNMVGAMLDLFIWQHVLEAEMDKAVWRQYNIPPFSYLKSNRQAALVLFPTDWAINNAEPLAPHMVAVGAITAAPAQALPSELEEFMQSAGDHGVVYASLGTTAIPELAELKAIAQGLSGVAPAKALWKLSDSDQVALGNASISVGSNVKIVKWVNQNDVLGHPRVKAFFTQGGTNSFNEGAYHGVPLVGMPLFAEQPDNIARAIDRGFALSVSVKKLDTLAKDLEQAIRRLLDEPSFAVSAAKVSHLMKAHRETPAQLAASAIEHAAWTRGSRHMQPLRDDLSWLQTKSLDVILFLASCTCVCAQSLRAQPKFAKSPVKIVVVPASPSSHWFQFLPIIRELSTRGHSVQVVFTPGSATRFGPALTELPNVEIVTYNTSNVEELDLRQAIREGQRSVGFESIRSTFGMPLHSHPLLQDVELHRNIQAFKPDLALIDFVLAGGGALADKLGIPKAINCITGVVPPVVEHAYGSGASLLSSVPQWMSLAPRKMTFLQRVNNMVAFVMNLYCWQCVIEPQMDKIFWRQYDIAPYSYFKSNRQAALVLLPSDWANAEPLAPHMVTIGAITAAPAKVLPSELEEFMQSAGDHDVVYASLGTTAIPEVAVAPKAAPTASMRGHIMGSPCISISAKVADATAKKEQYLVA